MDGCGPPEALGVPAPLGRVVGVNQLQPGEGAGAAQVEGEAAGGVGRTQPEVPALLTRH